MSSHPMVGQDEGTQHMVQDAQANFPDSPLDGGWAALVAAAPAEACLLPLSSALHVVP